MESVNSEIERVIQDLGLSENEIRPLRECEGFEVYSAIVKHFVASGERRQWWEDFRAPATRVTFDDGRGWENIVRIVPTGEKVWLIAEDDERPSYPVYEAFPECAERLIEECSCFEYYLVAKDLSWLLCETHHNVMFAIGAEVEENLRRLRSGDRNASESPSA
ncbi:MAG TPA: DUF6756 family protein [Blastocatellia bacterium]|nr:DUF6756 family protein [Blastocatellia bacterium]